MSIICCATPSMLYTEETRSTLLFASRAKLVKTNAQVNEVVDPQTMIRRLQREIVLLRRGGAGEKVSQLERQIALLKKDKIEYAVRVKRLNEAKFGSAIKSDQVAAKRPRLSLDHGAAGEGSGKSDAKNTTIKSRLSLDSSRDHHNLRFCEKDETSILRAALDSKQKAFVNFQKQTASQLRDQAEVMEFTQNAKAALETRIKTLGDESELARVDYDQRERNLVQALEKKSEELLDATAQVKVFENVRDERSELERCLEELTCKFEDEKSARIELESKLSKMEHINASQEELNKSLESTLTSQAQEFEESLRMKTNELANVISRLETAESTCHDQEAHIEALRHEKLGMETNLCDQESRLAAKVQENDTLLNQIACLSDSNASLEKKVLHFESLDAERGNLVAEMQQKLNTVTADWNRDRGTLAILQAENKSLTTTLLSVKSGFEESEAQLQGRIADDQSKIDALEANLQSLRESTSQQLASKENDIANLLNEKRCTEDEVYGLKHDAEIHSEWRTKAENELTNAKAKIVDNEARFATLNENIEKMKSEMATIGDQLSIVNGSLRDKEEKCKCLTLSLNETTKLLHEAAEHHRGELSTLREHHKDSCLRWETEKYKFQKKLQHSLLEVRTREQRLESATEHSISLEAKIRSLSQDIQKADNDLRSARELESNLRSDISELESQNATSLKTIDSQNERIRGLMKHDEQLGIELSKLKDDHGALVESHNERISNMESRLAQKHQEHEETLHVLDRERRKGLEATTSLRSTERELHQLKEVLELRNNELEAQKTTITDQQSEKSSLQHCLDEQRLLANGLKEQVCRLKDEAETLKAANVTSHQSNAEEREKSLAIIKGLELSLKTREENVERLKHLVESESAKCLEMTQTIDEWKNTAAESQSKVEELELSNSALLEKLESTNEELSSAVLDNSAIRDKLVAKDALVDQLSVKQDEVLSCSKNKDDIISQLRLSIDALSFDLKTSRCENTSQLEIVSSLQEQVKIQCSQIHELEGLLQATRNQIQELESGLEKSNSLLVGEKNLQARTQELQEQVSSLEEQLLVSSRMTKEMELEYTTEKARLANIVEQKCIAAQALSVSLQRALSDCDMLGLAKEEANNRAQRFNDLYLESNIELEKASAELSSVHCEKDRIAEQLKQMEEEVRSLVQKSTSDRLMWNEKLLTIDADNLKLKADIKEITSNLDSQTQQCRSLKSAVESKDKDYDKLASQYESLRVEASNKSAELAAVLSQRETWNNEVSAIEREREELKQEYAAIVKSKDAVVAECATHKKALAEAHRSAEESKDIASQMTTRCKQLEFELDRSNTTISNLECQVQRNEKSRSASVSKAMYDTLLRKLEEQTTEVQRHQEEDEALATLKKKYEKASLIVQQTSEELEGIREAKLIAEADANTARALHSEIETQQRSLLLKLREQENTWMPPIEAAKLTSELESLQKTLRLKDERIVKLEKNKLTKTAREAVRKMRVSSVSEKDSLTYHIHNCSVKWMTKQPS